MGQVSGRPCSEDTVSSAEDGVAKGCLVGAVLLRDVARVCGEGNENELVCYKECRHVIPLDKWRSRQHAAGET